MTNEELKSAAAAIATEMAGGALTPELRRRFIEVRAALFNRGVFDPVLARFDSATVTQVGAAEAAAQLAKWVAAV